VPCSFEESGAALSFGVNLLFPTAAHRHGLLVRFMDKTFIYDGFRICMYINPREHGVIMEPSKKPLNVLIKQLHGNIEVVLKNGCEYKGKMIKCDGHMNILLEGATECKQEQLLTNYGNVLLRGNNILYIILDAAKH
jgi:small nuclear ribonucleoprotein